MTHSLEAQRTRAHNGGRGLDDGHAELVSVFAKLNGCNRSESDFNLPTLARNGVTDSEADPWDKFWLFSAAFDHKSWLRRDRRATMLVTEPYACGDIAQLPEYVANLGLVLHQPPNPLASLYWPGCTHFIAITRPDFGEVRWLPEQLAWAAFEPRRRAS